MARVRNLLQKRKICATVIFVKQKSIDSKLKSTSFPGSERGRVGEKPGNEVGLKCYPGSEKHWPIRRQRLITCELFYLAVLHGIGARDTYALTFLGLQARDKAAMELRSQRRGMPLSLIPNMATVAYAKCKPTMKGACFTPLLIINNKAFLSFVSLENDNVLISLYPVTKHERK